MEQCMDDDCCQVNIKNNFGFIVKAKTGWCDILLRELKLLEKMLVKITGDANK